MQITGVTKRDQNDYTPEAVGDGPVDVPEDLALSGSTYAVAAIVERCEAFHKRRRRPGGADEPVTDADDLAGKHQGADGKFYPAKRAGGRFVARDQNLMALHWMRMALAAFVRFDAEITELGGDAGEHAPRMELGELRGSAPTLITNNERGNDDDERRTEARTGDCGAAPRTEVAPRGDETTEAIDAAAAVVG